MYNKCNQSGKKKYTNLKAHTEIRIHKLESTCSKCSSVICCGQHFFPVPFWGKILRYRIIVVTTLKPIQKITLIFVNNSWLSKVIYSAIKTLNLKEVESGNGILQNHCSHNAKTNLKDNSENALLCSLLKTFNTSFFKAFQGNTISYQLFQFERSWFWKWYLQNHCSHNAKANSKDNSENAILCSLLWHSTDLFS